MPPVDPERSEVLAAQSRLQRGFGERGAATIMRARLGADEFDVFISYSRKDKAFASRLERTLERYRPPKTLAVPQRRLHVFRDEGDMTGVEYHQSLDRFLQGSTKLVVVCSPSARQSSYVDDEIRRFAAVHGAEHVVPVLLDGIPNNEAGPDQVARMAFPEALCGLLSMPLAVSYAGFHGRTHRIDGGMYESAWYMLLADLYGVSRDEIEQRERRRRRRRRATMTAVTGSVMAALATLAAVAWIQKTEAERQRSEAERQRDVLFARQLAFQAQALLETGIGDMLSRGTLLGVEAMRRWPSLEATEALQRVLRSRRPLLWEAEGGGLGPGSFVSFSPDESALVAVDRVGRVVDVATGELIRELEPGPTNVAWSPDGSVIAGTTDGGVVLWSAADGSVVGRMGRADVSALAFSRRGDRLAASADGAEIMVFRIPDGEPIVSLSRPVEARYPRASALSFHPDGDLLASVMDVGDPDDPEGFRADVWSLGRGALLRTPTFDGPVGSVSFSHDGRTLAVGVRGTVRLLDVATWTERSRVGADEARDMVSVSFDRSDQLVAALGWDDPARVWRAADGVEVARLEHERGATGAGRVSAIALSPSGRYAATIGDDMLRLWLLEARAGMDEETLRRGTGDRRLSEFGNIVPPDPGQPGAAVDGEGRRVLQWSGDRATLLEPAEGKERAELTFPEPILRGLVSPDGRLAALLGASGAARVFDGDSGRELETLRRDSGVEMAALSGRASRVAFVDEDRTLRILSSTDGLPAVDLSVTEPVEWAAFSPGGAWLIASADGNAFMAIDVSSGEVAARFIHDRPMSTFLFTADERYLATASDNDGTARILDLKADRELLRWHLKTNLQSVEIGFADNDRVFEFVGTEYDYRRSVLSGLWRPDDLVEAACATVRRDLTADEWKQYLPAWEPPRSTCPAAGGGTGG